MREREREREKEKERRMTSRGIEKTHWRVGGCWISVFEGFDYVLSYDLSLDP